MKWIRESLRKYNKFEVFYMSLFLQFKLLIFRLKGIIQNCNCKTATV